MQLIHIAPTKNLSDFANQPMMMFLTHLVLKDPEYREFARRYRGYKILDNSLIECGESLTIQDVCNAADMIGANEIILPDMYMDGVGTIAKTTIAYDWIRHNKSEEWIAAHKFMGVAQGKTEDEWVACYARMLSLPYIDVIGIPKNLAKVSPRGRADFENYWAYSSQVEARSKEIHLLGLYYTFNELKQYEHPELIRSCDTCHLYFLAKHGMDFYDVRPDGHTVNLEEDDIKVPLYLVRSLEKLEASLEV